ncbi:hypothetical protein KUCAC02_003057 [Chaenocephalus aceratus]|uniref:Uncharacterized protein n=1 Tax=Chaenocephalus aceratus TaxID=36190 RepID=A0ACB9WKK4_CHAAC|nr:hypothetical protein KUCAC02_003057 [Chaenocephalus aceratus]
MRGSPMTSAHSHMKGPTGERTMPGRAYRAGQGRVGPPCWYHPLSLCNTSEDERQEGDFITIVQTGAHCTPLSCRWLIRVRLGQEGVGLAQRCYVASGSEPWLWM